MNYLKHYNLLIEKYRSQTFSEDQYFECHHIIPKCLGGGDSSENLIDLTPEQHYTAHLLLARIYNIDKLWYACAMMTNGLSGRSNKYYGWLRRKISKYHSDRVKNKWAIHYGFDSYIDQCITIWSMFKEVKSTEVISKKFGMAVANVNRSLAWWAETNDLDEELNLIRRSIRSDNSKNIRRNITPEQEARRISAVRNADYSKRKGTRSGNKNPMYGINIWENRGEITCPHCNLTKKDSPAFRRWHMDYCKERKQNAN